MGNKINREDVWLKYGKRCAYCGKEISIKEMQVDHIEPHWHTITEKDANRLKIKKGSHEFDNLNPSCARCNKWKSTYSLEEFRNVIQTSIMRLERDTPNFRLSRDYGLVEVKNNPVCFYFEKKLLK